MTIAPKTPKTPKVIAQPTKPISTKPTSPKVSKKFARHAKVMRRSDGSCRHLFSPCAMSVTSNGSVNQPLVQNVQDRTNHPRWSGIPTDKPTE